MDRDDATIGVIIVDDHLMFAESLARILADEPDIEVLGVAADGQEGIDLAARVKPRVALVDYKMPDKDGVAVVGAIKRSDPTTMVVFLTGSADDRVLLDAIDAGCSGFLTKDRAATDVVSAVRAAAAGEALISAASLSRLLPRLSRTHVALGSDLSTREREVLVLVARGMANSAIAEHLMLSVNTVRNYVQSLLSKLGAHSKLEAVATAVREGIIDYPSS